VVIIEAGDERPPGSGDRLVSRIAGTGGFIVSEEDDVFMRACVPGE